jgi:hypothetical protein
MLDFVYLYVVGSQCLPYQVVGVFLSQVGVCNMSLYSGESLFMTHRIICSAEPLFFDVFKFRYFQEFENMFENPSYICSKSPIGLKKPLSCPLFNILFSQFNCLFI